MGKDIGIIYKYIQSQLPTSSLKATVSSSSVTQTSSAIKSTTTSVPSVRDKNQNNYVFYYQNTIQNDASITNTDNIQSCDISRKQKHCISTTSTPNQHTQLRATTSESILNLHTPTILPPVCK